VPTPLKFHGRIVGAPCELTYAKGIQRSFEALDKASDCASMWTIGKTDEGRDLVLLAIADEATIKRLASYKERLRRLTDPRTSTEAEAQQLLRTAKPIDWLTSGVHRHARPPRGADLPLHLHWHGALQRGAGSHHRGRIVALAKTEVMEMTKRVEQSALLIALNHVAKNKDTRLENYWLNDKRSIRGGQERTGQRMGDSGQPVPEGRCGRRGERAAPAGPGDPPGDRPFKAGNVDVAAGTTVAGVTSPTARSPRCTSPSRTTPANPRPYDDTGWTFQCMRNVKQRGVRDASIFGQPMTMLTSDAVTSGGVEGAGDTLIVGHTTETIAAIGGVGGERNVPYQTLAGACPGRSPRRTATSACDRRAAAGDSSVATGSRIDSGPPG